MSNRRSGSSRDARRAVEDPEREMDRVVAAARARIAAAEAEEWEAEAADQIRVDQGKLGLCDRLAERIGAVVSLHVRGIGPIQGRVTSVGREWLAMAGPNGRGYVAIRAIDRFSWSGKADDGIGGRPDDASWKSVVRSLAVAGRPVSVSLVDGVRLRGRLTRCGDDHFDLVSEEAGAPGSAEATVVALRAVAAVIVN